MVSLRNLKDTGESTAKSVAKSGARKSGTDAAKADVTSGEEGQSGGGSRSKKPKVADAIQTPSEEGGEEADIAGKIDTECDINVDDVGHQEGSWNEEKSSCNEEAVDKRSERRLRRSLSGTGRNLSGTSSLRSDVNV